MLRKLILPHVFIFNILTTQAQESSLEFKTESEILLDNISHINNGPVIKNIGNEFRFEYRDSNIKLKRYKAILKKGSLIKSLKTRKVERIPRGVMVSVRDVAVGSHFSVIFDKFDTPIYLCETEDLQKTKELLQITPKYHGKVKKSDIKFNSTDLKKDINFQAVLYGANYTLKDFNSTSANAFGLTTEFSLINNQDYPVYIHSDLSRLTSNQINWIMLNVGMKFAKKFENFEVRIGAETTVLGNASYPTENNSLRTNKMMIGVQKSKGNFLFEIEGGLNKLIYSNDTNFETNDIVEGNNYNPYIAFKVGYGFNLGVL